MPELTGLEGPGAQASIVSTDTHSPEEKQYRRQRIKDSGRDLNSGAGEERTP